MTYRSSPIGKAVERLRAAERIQTQSIAMITGTLEALTLGDWHASDDKPVMLIQTLSGTLASSNSARSQRLTEQLVDVAFVALRTGDFEPRSRKGVAFAELVNSLVEARLDQVEGELAIAGANAGEGTRT